ncbi:hypothetical protein B0H13DRAFT_2281005 [Mycena leptocephala]|nr:hypothetical protein B0H13DRAFT_2281005 [Mycena leptocephala]
MPAAVHAASSSDDLVKVVENEEVQAIGNTILEGVPAIMMALETLTEIHPFLMVAVLPFKLMYHQEFKRREKDQKRTVLFEKVKDVMLVLLELKTFTMNDTRTTPDGTPVLSRVASICVEMRKDIEECYNALNAHEKRSVAVKFLRASSWNKELAEYAVRFIQRREDLTFALIIQTPVSVEALLDKMMEKMAQKMENMLATMLSPQEKDIGRWINYHGGGKTVLESPEKYAAMIEYEANLASTDRMEQPDKLSEDLGSLIVPVDNSDFLVPGIKDSRISPLSPLTGSEVQDSLSSIWRGLQAREANISTSEKVLNKFSDTATGAVDELSSNGIIDLVKSEVQQFGKVIIFEGVPAIMDVLEELAKVHSFLMAAYIPFKVIYQQETRRRENDQKRTILFGTIKDFMFALSELKILKEDSRTTPEGKSALGRLPSICEEAKRDIEACYNVLDAQERRSIAIKFLKASSWNKELATYAARFTERRDQLSFGLDIRTAVNVEEIKSQIGSIEAKMEQLLATMLSPQETDMGRWIHDQGGEEVVLASYEKCARMIEYEASLTASRRIGSLSAGKISGADAKKNEAEAVAALRREYHEDIQGIIQENFGRFSNYFDSKLEDFGKDLENEIRHQGDRVIKHLKGGPHSRIKDKMISHLWEDQGWKGDVATRSLVVALHDYFKERVQRTREEAVDHLVSSVPRDDDDDPETSWMATYLQAKHLRHLQQALDPDASGFTTILEINAFTRARPENWRLPRWIAYWAMGWQIFATKYCVEIEELFVQMTLLNHRIGIQMPGNKRYVNTYVESIWMRVTALTSAIERDISPVPWLEENFVGYIQAQEHALKGRLEEIRYTIGSIESVTSILRGDRIEGSIFILLALLMRRHVAKMHLCLTQEIDSRELSDDMNTIAWVVFAVWNRFLDLKEQFEHQQIPDLKLLFERLSCGLFKNYWAWGDWIQSKYFRDGDMTPWSFTDTICEVDQSELTGILVYAEPSSKSHDSFLDNTPTVSLRLVKAPAIELASLLPTVVDFSTDNIPGGPSRPILSTPSAAEMSITGTWYGWRWTESLHAMIRLNFECGDRRPDLETNTSISGCEISVDGRSWTVSGVIDSADKPQGSLAVNFGRHCDNHEECWIQYNGAFYYDRETITGKFECKNDNRGGSFLLKKVEVSAIMCSRSLVAELSTRDLWSFACNAVIAGIRRKKPTSSYIWERMKNIRRLLEFMFQNKPLNETEKAGYSKILKSFSFEEMSELKKLCDWYHRAVDFQPPGYSCDSCGDTIRRSRVVCLDCIPDQLERTVNFCSKPDCIASPALPQRTDVTHPPSHLMMKMRDFFLLKDYFVFKQRAGHALGSARRFYTHLHKDLGVNTSSAMPSAVSTNLTLEETPGQRKSTAFRSLDALISAPDAIAATLLETAGPDAYNFAPITNVPDAAFKCECRRAVVTPCWYCVDCEGVWVCDSCEMRIDEMAPWDFQKRYRAENKADAHNIFHLLVRVTGPTLTDVKQGGEVSSKDASALPNEWERVEQRIIEAVNSHVDKRLEEMESRLTAGLSKRLDEVESGLKQQLFVGLSNIERLLNTGRLPGQQS